MRVLVVLVVLLSPVAARASTVECLRGQTTAATYYVATNGADTNLGTEALPWRTIAFGVRQLAPGDTLCVGGGTYAEKNVTMSVSGTAAAPITIRNVQGERPVIDGALPDFQAIDGRWTPYDTAKNIYRSVNTYSALEFSSFIGGEIEASGKTFKLVGYLNRSDNAGGTHYGYEYLASDNHDFDRWTPRYVGPGIAYNDASGTGGHIFIRLVPPAASALHLSAPYPSWYTDYTSRFPDATTLNPNLYKVHIHGVSTAIFTNSDHVILDGIDLVHHQYGARRGVPGVGSNWTYRNLTIVPGLYGLRLNTGTHDVVVDHVTIEGRLPMWIGESDIKGAELVGAPVQTVGITVESAVHGLTVRNSTLNHLFDGILLSSAGQHDHKIVSNRADDIRDDFVQLATSSYNIEIGGNLIKGAGPSHHANGDQPSGHQGTKYIHHNIIDASMPTLWVRNDPKGYYTSPPGAPSWQSPNPISNHGANCPGGDPWKIYQNTFVLGNRIYSGFVGAHLYSTGGMNNDTDSKHEVYNNIFVEVANNTYYPDARNYFMRKWQVTEPWEVYDGNLYHRAPGGTNRFMFLEVANAGFTSYHHLAAFLSSPANFKATQDHYEDGWESHGVEADPQLIDAANGNYRPAPGSPALAGAVSLAGRNWPGAAATGWRGALPGITGPTDQLVGYWSFDDEMGTTARDLSGAGHDGTLVNGPTWTAGLVGTGALDFDDTDDYVSVPNHADFNFGADTNFSITAWFRVDSPTNMGNIVMKGLGGTGGKRYKLATFSTGKLLLEVDDDIQERILTSAQRVDDGNWHFVAVTVDRDGYMYLYVDGGSTWTRANIANAGSFDDTSQPLKIGGTTQYFNGAIDEVRIYRGRILTPAEIDGLYDERP